MPDTHDAQRKAAQIFARHIEPNYQLDDIEQLGNTLNVDPAVLRALYAHCLAEERMAMQRGHHTEARRIGNLAQQLAERIK